MYDMLNCLDISIIIPAYNAAKHIGRCLNSILTQEKSVREIIVVNDGSTDNTADVLKDFENRYSNIIIIDQINSGVAMARDVGVKHAKAEYIWFIDADDEMLENALIKIYSNAHNSDMSICGFNMAFNNKGRPCSFYKTNDVINCQEFILKMMNAPNTFYYGVVWNKLYKRDIIISNNIKFDKFVTWGEDFIFNMNYLSYCETINIVPESVYRYYRNTVGLTVKSLVSIVKDPVFNSKIKLTMFKAYKDMLIKHNLYYKNKFKANLFIIGMTLFY